ncbi:MAG: 3-phosphoserine/phosphohydroxythreonine transaminase [Bacteroidetes bacterium]|nr:3-phosphoserine/phosphohydroxythreonine transaminase [Bacteroidota bacterium]MDA0950765.1 3-phosphoserine/phosphohydroxythreonine transaminase [Bacteroidota bacterium]
MKKLNFGAGPCILPQSVFEESAKAVLDFQDQGLSILEISHRSKAFEAVIEEARSLLLELMGLKESEYVALFLQGGASLQFAMIPYNFLKTKAAYIDTGVWSQKAVSEAEKVGKVEIVASSKKEYFTHIPSLESLEADYDYLHLTSNNTIYGTQFHQFPKGTNIPLIADMSSDILSTSRDYSAFDLIYAGAQKNIGPAGTTIVVIKRAFLEKVNALNKFKILNYTEHVKADSMLNTPTVFSIYASLLNLRWLKSKTLAAIYTENTKKATLLYDTLDRYNWIHPYAHKTSRSQMNITFTISENSHAELFDSYCNKYDIHGLKGHRLVGGYRASLYNALTLDSVKRLTEALDEVNTHV